MRWQGREGSKNVEDRRKTAGPAVAGGGGIVVVIIVVLFTLLRGGDPQQALQQGVQQLQQQQVARADAGGRGEVSISPEEDEQAKFASVVLRETEDVWDQLFPRLVGKAYQHPKMVLFRGEVTSACGRASSAVGPFYCPGDSKVYLDLAFFDEMRTKFRAPGDFACAYVIAHEVGHHIQNLLGLSMKVQNLQQQSDQVSSNRLSVRLELQADFLAGVWAHHAHKNTQLLESGDIEEGIRAAQAIGDDTLQRQARGRVVPDAFTHGSAEQRVRWFSYGLKSGSLEDLNLLFETDYDQL